MHPTPDPRDSALPPSVAERLARLAPDQRAAATAPPGPVLCVAPAGSGKTTTLVARVAWLIATGSHAEAITVVAFNARAAEELRRRIDQALEPLAIPPGAVRVRTFHALGREILAESGVDVDGLVDRGATLRRLWPDIPPAAVAALDLAFSRLKLDLGVRADDVRRDPAPGPVARSFVAYEDALRDAGELDFDDLLASARRLLEADAAVLATWRARARDLLVDEAQDLDRTQLELALLLAAPDNRVFLVGDDDQTIYGWRLADVRRVLGLAAALPGLRRVYLEVNYRCPGVVVERAVRLVGHNRERFVKRIRARAEAPGRLVLAPDPGDEVARLERGLAALPPDGTRAVLARSNRELLPALVVALELGRPFRAPDLPLPLEDPRLDHLLALVAATPAEWPLLRRLGAARDRIAADPALLDADTPALPDADDPAPPADPLDVGAGSGGSALDAEALAAAVLAWGAACPTLASLGDAIADRRARLAALRRDDAPFSLATAHGTKGLEFDHVVVLADGFPARRAVTEAAEPARVLEEERRLAYVAWTRARRTLVLLYDPESISPFIREAFDPAEMPDHHRLSSAR